MHRSSTRMYICIHIIFSYALIKGSCGWGGGPNLKNSSGLTGVLIGPTGCHVIGIPFLTHNFITPPPTHKK